MAVCKIKKDVHGLYVRKDGYLFRPMFPAGFDPKNPEVVLNEGEKVSAYYNGEGAYIRLKVKDNTLYWMKHGVYIIPDGDGIKHLKSNEIILTQSPRT